MREISLYNDDCLSRLDKLEAGSIDCIITDPPYELNFMGKGWDNAGISFRAETWAKCLRVLKPGGHLLAFGGSRTFHRIACAIEDASFELRDTIMWLYGSGFPKSMNIGLAVDKKLGVESKVVGKGKSGREETHVNSLNLVKGGFGGEYEVKEAQNEWKGWGTCLKPSFEPIIVARKPFKGSLVDNALRYGVGGLNIGECRVGDESVSSHNAPKGTFAGGERNRGSDTNSYKVHTGRFPANTILTYSEEDKEEVCGGFPRSKGGSGKGFKKEEYEENGVATTFTRGDFTPYNDDGSAARYFYCAKASKKDRDEGLEGFVEKTSGQMTERKEGSAGITAHTGSRSPKRNNHPTVKPTSLMQYLVRLVAPKGATILDPFMGSGSTGKAVMYENKERETGYKFIGIEKDPKYFKIAEARIKYAKEKVDD